MYRAVENKERKKERRQKKSGPTFYVFITQGPGVKTVLKPPRLNKDARGLNGIDALIKETSCPSGCFLRGYHVQLFKTV